MQNNNTDNNRLAEIAREIRVDVLNMLATAGSGHTGGSLSAVDLLTVLYFHKMRHNPENPELKGRDKFVLSKGHAAPALYAVLAKAGYFEHDKLSTLRKSGSMLSGHPDSKITPGIEVSTGSLGQGLSQANGLALSVRLDNSKSRVYVMLGDGEVEEGQVWEAAMTSSHYKIDNLCAILDNNGLQIDGKVEDVMSISPIADKWRSFGWHVIEIDGHDINQICSAFDEAEQVTSAPAIIIAKTVKGKGVSFMEGKYEYHGIAPTQDELKRGLEELRV